MINPVIKIIQSWFNKKNISIYKRYLNKKTILTGIFTIILLTAISYLIIPSLTNYDLDKEILEKKTEGLFFLG